MQTRSPVQSGLCIPLLFAFAFSCAGFGQAILLAAGAVPGRAGRAPFQPCACFANSRLRGRSNVAVGQKCGNASHPASEQLGRGSGCKAWHWPSPRHAGQPLVRGSSRSMHEKGPFWLDFMLGAVSVAELSLRISRFHRLREPIGQSLLR